MARRSTARLAPAAEASGERGAQAIHRAMTVLEAFSSVRPSLTLTEITDYAGLTVPTAHRMVRALQSRGYITHDPITGYYSLGSSVMRLAQVMLRRSEQSQVATLAIPHLERLRDLTGETAGIHTIIGRDRVCVAEFPSHHIVRMASGIGCVYPLYAGAAGKALLSGLAPERCEEMLALEQLSKLTPNTIIDIDQLRREIAEAREVGYATSVAETTASASALAAPVYGADGVVAAINIAGPATRWTLDAMHAALPALMETVALLGEHLGSTDHGLHNGKPH
ncbi:MAG: putative transcriptional regulator, IclR family [Subtercola sp.]|nr:putative transcriptional regulator, IclR family [Subtercola sp.]